MPVHYRVQSVAASTAYSQLHTAAVSLELDRGVTHLSGSFGAKTVHGSLQWYFNFRDVDQRVRQIYVGPDTQQVRTLVDRARAGPPGESLRPLAKSAVALGCAHSPRKHLSAILRMSQYGFFRAGGVLVGSHAFLAYANQVGLRWTPNQQESILDIADLGHTISIAMAPIAESQHQPILETLQTGFVPLVHFRGSAGASGQASGEPPLQIDLLTPKQARSNRPVALPPGLATRRFRVRGLNRNGFD